MGTPLNELCELIVDSEHKTAPVADDGYPMIRTPNIGEGRFLLDGVRLVDEDTYAAWTRRAVPREGDLILAREAPVGNVAMIQPGMQPILGQRTVLIRPNREKVAPAYLQYLMLGRELQHRMWSQSNGATVPHLNMKDIRSLDVPELPSLTVQRKIAAVLAAYDELIENNLRRIEILEEMAQAVYREWFVNFRFPGYEAVALVDSPLGPIPEGWEVSSLGDRVELAYGKALKADSRKGGPVPVLGSSGVIGWHDEALAEGPGIVVGRKGNVGSVHWVDVDFYPIDTTFYVVSDLSLQYLFHNLRDQHFINSDAAVPGLNRNQAYSNPLVVPAQSVVDQFDARLTPMSQLVRNLRTQNANLRSTRDLLLPKLVSGELDVSDLDIDTEWLAS